MSWTMQRTTMMLNDDRTRHSSRWMGRSATLLIAAAFVACGGDRQQIPPTDQEPSRIALGIPGRTNSAPSLAAWGKTVAIAWTASTDTQSDIYLAVSTDSGATFGSPVRVNDLEGDARASGEQPARVVVGSGNVMHVVWPSRQNSGAVIRYALSTDSGKSFSTARTVAGSGLTGARGWEALTLGYDGGIHLLWLDGRNAAAKPAGGHAHAHGATSAKMAGGPRQDVFHAALGKDGLSTERLVSANVCFCCKTAIATSGDKVFAAWRHIFPGGIRDIAIARSSDNGATFGAPVRVSDDGWKIDACPDDGPAMAADGHGRIHLAWPTMVPGETPRKGIFYSAISEEGTFSPRVRLDFGDADAAHPQIASDEHGQSAIVWDERADGGRQIVMRRVSDGKPAAPDVFSAEAGLYPVVAAADGHWVLAWSEQGSDGRQVIAGRQLPLSARP